MWGKDDTNYPTGKFRNIIITVDPNGGGSNEAAIGIFGFIRKLNKYVILYMASDVSKNYSEFKRLVFGTIIKFNDLYPSLYDVKKMVFVETNCVFSAGALVESYEKMSIISEKKIGDLQFAGTLKRYGIYKTGQNTALYIQMTQRAALLNNIVLCDRFANLVEAKVPMSKLRKQMETFPRIKGTEYKTKKTKGELQDDLLICLFMFPYWHGESLIDNDLFVKTNKIDFN